MIQVKNSHKLSAALVFIMLTLFASLSIWSWSSHSKSPAQIISVKPIPAQILGISTSGHNYTSSDNAQPINVSPGTVQTTGAPLCIAVPADDTLYPSKLCASTTTGTAHTDHPYTNAVSVDDELFPVDPAGKAQATGAPHCAAMPTDDNTYWRNLCSSNCIAACMNPF